MAAIIVPADPRGRQRDTLALIVATGALVLPISAAVGYGVFDPETSSRLLPFTAAANATDVIGPLLLVGALAIGVIRGVQGASRTMAIAVVLVAGAACQGIAFAVVCVDLAISHSYALPDTSTWQITKWSLVGRFAIQAATCAAVAAFAVRLMGRTGEERR